MAVKREKRDCILVTFGGEFTVGWRSEAEGGVEEMLVSGVGSRCLGHH